MQEVSGLIPDVVTFLLTIKASPIDEMEEPFGWDVHLVIVELRKHALHMYIK